MSGIFEEPDSATPPTPEEMRALIPSHIAYRRELNEAEQENIARAEEWAFSRRRRDLVSEVGLSAYTRSRMAVAVMPA